MKRKNNLRPEAACQWLEKAKRDLDTAWLNHKHKGYTDVTCYFCHQTAEKTLKAFLVYHSIRFKKIHVLPSLLQSCILKDKTFSRFQRHCRILNDYYIETKYPLEFPIDYSKKEAEEALELAEEILEFIKKKIKSS
ncbi:MAG: HEPN domain-containing protein [Patescibacteria group bacterium]